MEEIWKDVKGYEGLYKISNLGNVYSVKRARKLKLLNSHHGYKRIRLYIGSKSWKTYAVHRLVAEAFIPNPHNLPEVNHKDENPSNNVASNLVRLTSVIISCMLFLISYREWCTRIYNTNYGKRTEKTYSAVEMISFDGIVLKEFRSQVEASKEMGIRQGSISNCCRGFAKTAGGYQWRYKNG